ncbi:MarR family winged helix-turn-helix transcriptional regulator [Streptomyces coelicoflavus]|uniref:MarR family winged helix-turn-helix transcriptional regulator n=1 Tax=Streptomyces coelicoflavus TaxID=285562 RepID=UPI0036257B5B
MTEPSGQDRRLNDLERELTLLSRHFIASRGPRIGQSLDRSAYVLLTRLETGAPLTLKELAHTFQADVSTINRQMSTMLRHGLVERIDAAAKGGARTFRPTPLGLERLEADRTISRAGAARLIDAAGWDEDRTQQFLTLMVEFNHGIEQLEGLAWNHSARAGDPPAAE